MVSRVFSVFGSQVESWRSKLDLVSSAYAWLIFAGFSVVPVSVIVRMKFSRPTIHLSFLRLRRIQPQIQLKMNLNSKFRTDQLQINGIIIDFLPSLLILQQKEISYYSCRFRFSRGSAAATLGELVIRLIVFVIRTSKACPFNCCSRRNQCCKKLPE